MNNRNLKYEGTPSQLRRDVAATEVAGVWEEAFEGTWRYRCDDGAILEWRPTTDILSFQGPSQAAARFERKLVALLTDSCEVGIEYLGDIGQLMSDVAATGIEGKWQLTPPDLFHYWADDGAILSWCSSSGLLTVGGRLSAAARLRLKFFEVFLQ